MLTLAEVADPRVLVCSCGKVTTFRCKELWPHEGLVPCNAPLCVAGCEHHRHEPGTMGYAAFTRGSAEYLGDTPDGPGLWEWVKSRWRSIFWSNERKAQMVWDRLRAKFPPPAPLPPFVLRFGHRHFAAFGDTMKELE